MAKVNFKDKKALQLARHKVYGMISYCQMKDGRIIAAKWPVKRKTLKDFKK
ncbi:MAG: hypothetical protein IB617_02965 [Candidatus Nealsonbacteria bacterium]|nr:MAG: hypothetical protein IB617_02965 [Candidatus Nealsonbacteria bacterium]